MINLLRDLIKWANRDRVCAMAVMLGICGIFPHVLEQVIQILHLVGPSIASALGAK